MCLIKIIWTVCILHFHQLPPRPHFISIRLIITTEDAQECRSIRLFDNGKDSKSLLCEKILYRWSNIYKRKSWNQ